MTAAGETPLTMARRSGRLDIITILLEAGAAAITSSAGARSTTDNRNNQNNNNNGDDVGVTTSSSNATYRSAGTVGSSSHYTGTSNLSVSTEILSLTSPRDVNVFASARTLTPASGIRCKNIDYAFFLSFLSRVSFSIGSCRRNQHSCTQPSEAVFPFRMGVGCLISRGWIVFTRLYCVRGKNSTLMRKGTSSCR